MHNGFALYSPERHDELLKHVGLDLPFEPVSYIDEWKCRRCGGMKQFRLHPEGPSPLSRNSEDYTCGHETDLRIVLVPEGPPQRPPGGSWDRSGHLDPVMVERTLAPHDPLPTWKRQYNRYPENPDYGWEVEEVGSEVVRTERGPCPNRDRRGWSWPRMDEAVQQARWLALLEQWGSYLHHQASFPGSDDFPETWPVPSPDQRMLIELYHKLEALEQRFFAHTNEMEARLQNASVQFPVGRRY